MKKTIQKQKLERLTDDQLVAVFQADRGLAKAAFDALIHRHQPDLIRRCKTRLGNATDADEAVQETLLRVYRGLPRFRGDAAFRTWLYAIADNQCNTLSLRRSRQVMSEHIRALIVLHEELYQDDPGGEEPVAIEQVHEALSGLSGQARDVLMLRFYGDLSLEDIAKTLGIGLSAAKMRLYRALMQFEASIGA